MSKFPGGGLNLGEGIMDCLRREFREELGLGIEVGRHLYTTDHFIQSRFRAEEQVIAMYYMVHSESEPLSMQTTQDTQLGKANNIRFVWEKLNHNLKEILTFDSDHRAMDVLLREINEAD